MMRLQYSWFRPPRRFRRFRNEFKDRDVRLLDVGCGDHSPSLTRRWFPQVTYHGVDRRNYNNDEHDLAAMDRFFQLDLATDPLDEIPDASYDVVIFTHVIEHLPNGLDVLEALPHKLVPGGYIYVEFPSPRSLDLPSARGSLNFHDDPTHVSVFDADRVGRVLAHNGVDVLASGIARDHLKALAAPFLWPLQLLSLARYGKLDARWGLTDLTGFADFVIGQRSGRRVSL